VRTSNEDADTGWTTAGSVVITTKHGTNEWHGDAAFYDRQAALTPASDRESCANVHRRNLCQQSQAAVFAAKLCGHAGRPDRNKQDMFFTSFENVHENASIAYSPASTAQFDALAQLAADGLIDVNGTTVPSIAVPASVPIPFGDYLGSVRFDWAESSKSQWFLRTSKTAI